MGVFVTKTIILREKNEKGEGETRYFIGVTLPSISISSATKQHALNLADSLDLVFLILDIIWVKNLEETPKNLLSKDRNTE